MLKKIGILIVVGLVGFVGLLWYVLKRPLRDVSELEPFNQLIGNTCKLQTDQIIVLQRKPEVVVYPYAFYAVNDTYSDEAVLIDTLAKGTDIFIERVVLTKGPVSGTSHVLVLGSCISEKKEMPLQFEYYWGDYHWLNEEQPYWTFPKAIWQTEVIEGNFVLPSL